MTSTQESAGVHRIGEARAAAMALAEGSERERAFLHADVLEFVRDCQKLRDAYVSEECNKVDAVVDGVINRQRPFLTWDCCDAHRGLRGRRSELNARAESLGVKIEFDMLLVVRD